MNKEVLILRLSEINNTLDVLNKYGTFTPKDTILNIRILEPYNKNIVINKKVLRACLMVKKECLEEELKKS